MEQAIYAARRFYAPQSIRPGDFITQLDDPLEAHHTPPYQPEPEVKQSSLDSMDSEGHKGNRTTIRSKLISSISSYFSMRSKVKVHMTSNRILCYDLENSDDIFDAAIRAPRTRDWLERRLKRSDVYMIVAIYTTHDTRISQEEANKLGGGSQVTVPNVLDPTALIGDLLGLEMKLEHDEEDGGSIEYKVPGEQIFAWACRKVTHNWYEKKMVDNTFLGRSRVWISRQKLRSEEDEDDENVIEVELSEVGDLSQGWSKEMVGDIALYTPLDKRE